MLPALLLYRLQESIIREFAVVEQRVMIWRDDDAAAMATAPFQNPPVRNTLLAALLSSTLPAVEDIP